MRLELKRLGKTKDGKTRWLKVEVKELINKSVVDFMISSEDPIMAALKKEEELVALICNQEEYLEQYQDRTILCLTAEELKELVGTETFPPLAARVFEDCSFECVEYTGLRKS